MNQPTTPVQPSFIEHLSFIGMIAFITYAFKTEDVITRYLMIGLAICAGMYTSKTSAKSKINTHE